MNRDLTLAKEKRFSFIQTITIYPHRDNNELHHNSLVNKEISVAKIEENTQEVTSSSALCTKNIADDSSLNTNLINIPHTISNCWYPFNSDREIASVIYVPELEVNSAVKNSSKRSSFNRYLDTILLIFASGYLCFVFWWLFAAKNAFPLAFLSSQPTISQADVEFIDYMKQSLEVIDRVAMKQSPAKTVASIDKTSEVVYVPVYTPSSTPNSSDRNDSLPNIQLPPPPSTNNLAALNPPISTIKIQPPIPPSESVKVKTTPTESSSENAETPIAKSTSDNNSNEVAATITPNIEHTLVGLMELKEGSAALFKIGGVTQRIWLGEEIESTGWILDSVANQKAKISYQGKTLTLRVGENFQSNE